MLLLLILDMYLIARFAIVYSLLEKISTKWNAHLIASSSKQDIFVINFPVDTGRKLNIHKTFRRRPGRLLNVLCTFNLRPVSTGFNTQTVM